MDESEKGRTGEGLGYIVDDDGAARASSKPSPGLGPEGRRRASNAGSHSVQPLVGHRFGQVSAFSSLPATPQAKLTIGQPGDKYEQEADRVADQVMRMPERDALDRSSVCKRMQPLRIQRSCPACEEELQRQPVEEEEEEERLQAKGASSKAPEVTADMETSIGNLKGGGQPLPKSVRADFEPRFGYDFSQVRVHAERQAADSARTLNARAYTLGRDVVFGKGQYAPGLEVGRRLLGHELTHVIQQSGSAVGFLQRQTEKGTGEDNKCGKRGPPGREPGPPLIYSHLEARRLGTDENVRSKRKSVGYAQILLNRFLKAYAKDKRSTCIGDEDNLNIVDAQRKKKLLKSIEVNCSFGDDTDWATRMFQRCKKLNKIDGKIGEETWPILEKEPESKRKEPASKRENKHWLEQQLVCVLDEGGCSPVGPTSLFPPSLYTQDSLVAWLDKKCRAKTGYNGPVLTYDDLNCRLPSLAIGKSLDESYPGWLDVIPDCPCSARDAAVAWNFSRDINPFLFKHHPGADACYRSNPVASLAGTEHRQQCCYRGDMLITTGAGAGTPDVWTSFWKHQRTDVDTWDELGWKKYNDYWRPAKRCVWSPLPGGYPIPIGIWG